MRELTDAHASLQWMCSAGLFGLCLLIFCCSCEFTMCVLRRNKDSLMAVLEAFVYDPLLNWRLIDNKPKSKKSKTHGEVLLRLSRKTTLFSQI